MKYYIIAGEASGDLHGALLIKALKQVDSEARFRVWGGDLMEAEGASLAKHFKDTAFMGIVKVIQNLPTILGNMRYCKEDIKAFNPDVIIHIDYSGFNLRIAKWAKVEGFKTFYYISPQVWASRAKRVHTIKKVIDKMFVILPFEAEFYKNYDYPVEFIGHPLVEVIQNYTLNPDFRISYNLIDKPVIALLPGSRKQEITKMMSVLLDVVPKFPNHQFVIAGAPSMETEFYQQFMVEYDNVQLISNKTYDLFSIAEAAIVTSGTATLEAALFNVPQVICYKTNALLYWIAKRIIQLDFIGIVNIIMKRAIVKELIQTDCTAENLAKELNALLHLERRNQVLADYQRLESKLKGENATLKAAKKMYNLLK